MIATGPEPGWHPNPAGSGRERWWDGQAWTNRTKPSNEGNKPSYRPSSSSYEASPTTSSIERIQQADTSQVAPGWYDNPDGTGGDLLLMWSTHHLAVPLR